MRIHGYEIQETLATRGAAKVFRAVNRESEAQVALKIIDIVDESTRIQAANLYESARLIYDNPHPNICPVVEFGRREDEAFVAYSWQEPFDLLDGLARGMDLSQIKRVFVGLTRALNHLERLSLVHGDIKPQNILLRDNAEPILVDVTGGSIADGELRVSTLTRGYCSPEAWNGEPVDSRTDVYSLGVVLYRSLAGDVPWTDDTGVGRTATDEDIVPRLAGEYEPIQPVLDSALSYDRTERNLNLDVLSVAFDTIGETLGTPSVIVRSDLVSSEEIANVSPRIDHLTGTRTRHTFGGRKRALYNALAALGPLFVVTALWIGYIERESIQEVFSGLGIVEHPEFEQRWRTAQALRSDANQTLSAITAAYNRVLEIAPNHQGAGQAIEDVLVQWKDQIGQYIYDNELPLAQTRINELMRVYPNDDDIDGYLKIVNRMRWSDRLLDDTRRLQERTGIEDIAASRAAIRTYKEIVNQSPAGSPQREEALSELTSLSESLVNQALVAKEDRNFSRAEELLDLANDAVSASANIDSAREELSFAKTRQQEIDTNLQGAALHQQEGRLLLPPEDNAFVLFTKVLELDPDNQVAIKGLADVELQVRLKLFDQLKYRDFEAVNELIDAAKSQEVDPEVVVEMETVLQSELSKIDDAKELLVEATRFYRLGYISKPENANALHRLQEARELDPLSTQITDLIRQCAERLASVAEDAYRAGMSGAAREYLDAALSTGTSNQEWEIWRQEWFVNSRDPRTNVSAISGANEVLQEGESSSQ